MSAEDRKQLEGCLTECFSALNNIKLLKDDIGRLSPAASKIQAIANDVCTGAHQSSVDLLKELTTMQAQLDAVSY